MFHDNYERYSAGCVEKLPLGIKCTNDSGYDKNRSDIAFCCQSSMCNGGLISSFSNAKKNKKENENNINSHNNDYNGSNSNTNRNNKDKSDNKENNDKQNNDDNNNYFDFYDFYKKLLEILFRTINRKLID